METSGSEFRCQEVSWNECGKEKCAKTVIHLKIPLNRYELGSVNRFYFSLFLSSVIQIKMGNHDVQPNGLWMHVTYFDTVVTLCAEKSTNEIVRNTIWSSDHFKYRYYVSWNWLKCLSILNRYQSKCRLPKTKQNKIIHIHSERKRNKTKNIRK